MGYAGEPGRAEAPGTSGVADNANHDPAIVPVHASEETARVTAAVAAVDTPGADDRVPRRVSWDVATTSNDRLKALERLKIMVIL